MVRKPTGTSSANGALLMDSVLSTMNVEPFSVLSTRLTGLLKQWKGGKGREPRTASVGSELLISVEEPQGKRKRQSRKQKRPSEKK